MVFIDEIHRFHKGQQDALLPAIEEGLITLVGATTENPSFELNRALLSRVRVFVLEPLSTENIETILQRTLKHESQVLVMHARHSMHWSGWRCEGTRKLHAKLR
jgi:putative ATPase